MKRLLPLIFLVVGCGGLSYQDAQQIYMNERQEYTRLDDEHSKLLIFHRTFTKNAVGLTLHNLDIEPARAMELAPTTLKGEDLAFYEKTDAQLRRLGQAVKLQYEKMVAAQEVMEQSR